MPLTREKTEALGGVMGTTDFEKMQLGELVKLAKEKKIKDVEGMKKTQIVAALLKQQEKGPRLAATPQQGPAPASPVPIQGKVEESKFYMGPTAPQVFKESEFVFPGGYGQDKVVLLVRDPYWMHTYWEITSSKVGALKAQFGEQLINQSRLVLRLLDINDTTPAKPNRVQDIDITGHTNNWYLQVPNADCSYCVEVGFLAPDGRFILVARSNIVRTPRAGVSDVYDEQWMTLEDYDRVYGLSGGLGVGLSSGEIRRQMKKKFESLISSGGISSAAISSFGNREAKKRGFFLVVDTELIVYGVTVPDAKLTIQGVEKKLNPDGTFSARFALPDGKQEIPVTAVSSDKVDTITVTPGAEKKTV